MGAYILLLRDEYPSTDEEQAVHLDLDYPDAPRDLNRWLPLVKWILAIPHYVVLAVLGIAARLCIVIAWFAIIITRRYPRGLFDFVVGVNRWSLRVSAYAWLLITDRYPPFTLLGGPGRDSVGAGCSPPEAESGPADKRAPAPHDHHPALHSASECHCWCCRGLRPGDYGPVPYSAVPPQMGSRAPRRQCRIASIAKEAQGGAAMAAAAELMDRITVRQDVFGGKPIIRDLRMAVEHVLGMLAAGESSETILREHPVLEPEDIQACLLYAHRCIAGADVHERLPVGGA